MDDENVTLCFGNENDMAILREMIPIAGHRMRFIRAFREKLAETDGQVRNFHGLLFRNGVFTLILKAELV